MRPGPRWLLIAGAYLVGSALPAQRARPVLDGQRVVAAADSLWEEAVARGTRSADGAPGVRHWVQSARYDMHVTISPSLRAVQAEGLLRYRNRSPDTLRIVGLSLAQNLFAPNAPHDEMVPVTGGMSLDGFCVARLTRAPAARLCDDKPAGVTADLRVDHTVAWLTLPAPLLPGDSLDVRAQWHFTLPTEDAPRMGSDGSVALVAYWYPQFRVYDDVVGWDGDPYLATGEFYMDHADYDVRITVPSAMLVGATGTLRNADAVLTPLARERLQRAAHSFAVVPVVSDSMRRTHAGTLAGATLTWHFSADSVRDFTWYASRDVVWDAMAALVPRSAGSAPDTVLVHALYRPRVRSWRAAADDGRRSIEQFSRLLWPYPWPQITLVEGIVDGGMEYPMLTAVSVGPDARELRSTLAHEIGHMWFPMQVGTDERRFAWVDEGFASWLERAFMRATTGTDDDEGGLPSLYRVLGLRNAPSMQVHADHYAGAMAYTMASYDKPVVVLRAFAAEYGDSALLAGIRALGARWSGRHPYPADITRTLFAAAGSERDAFVREWVQGTGTFDASIGSVTRARDTLEVQVRVRGGARLSVPVVVTRDDGTSETTLLPAAAFRATPVQVIRIAKARRVRSITLDPSHTRPDIDPGNQQWTP